MAGAQVGARCVLGQNVFVGARAVIGDGCRIQNGVSIYDGVVLADEVFVGPQAVFTNVRTPRAFVSRKDALGATHVGRGATIGANATVVCGVTIGAYALIGAGAVVTRDVAAHALVTGASARPAGWACRCGEVLRPTRRRARCAACAAEYRVVGAAGAARLVAAV
jgi:UDP-2-acetamido-3-amino-2,3-dideoxy-glucuronate N-acetyltransferase